MRLYDSFLYASRPVIPNELEGNWVNWTAIRLLEDSDRQRILAAISVEDNNAGK